MPSFTGSCHCGAVRFTVEATLPLDVVDCNCSICTKKGILHLIVPESALAILAGGDALATYTFGTHTAKHMFCRTCGIHPFYRPRSHPDGWTSTRAASTTCRRSRRVRSMVSTGTKRSTRYATLRACPT